VSGADDPEDPTAGHLHGGVVVASADKTILDSRQAADGASSQASRDASHAVPGARYEDLGEIAHGGMGSVRRVFDRVLLRTVALKTLRFRSDVLNDADQFVEEAQITGQLDHPNIVPVYDFGVTATDHAFFTMKLVDGETLASRIRKLHAAGFPADGLEAIVAVFQRVCDAVAFAHSRGVIHRDLKPANVMIGSHGQVYVMDWGLGLLRASTRPRAAGSDSTPVVTAPRPPKDTHRIEGTVSYMAPEQVTGHDELIDERTDVFGLGAILYEVLTNRPPYVGKDIRACLEAARDCRMPHPQALVAHPLPPGLCEIALRAMRPRPDIRYPSAEALGADLARFQRGGGWFSTRILADGEVVMREGEVADSAYVILEGRCEVYREHGGRRDILRQLGPGDAFGEMALLSARPRTASVVAKGPTTVKVVTAAAFQREMERSSWLAAIMGQLAARFAELDTTRSGSNDWL